MASLSGMPRPMEPEMRRSCSSIHGPRASSHGTRSGPALLRRRACSHRSAGLRPVRTQGGAPVPPRLWARSCCAWSTNGTWPPASVGPDVGTGAVLFALSEALDRFPSAVVGSGGASFPLEVTGALKDIIEAPDLTDSRESMDATSSPGAGRHRATHPARGRTRGLPDFLRGRSVRRVRGLVRQLSFDLPILRRAARRHPDPGSIIAGRHDTLVPPSNAEFLPRGSLTASSTSSRPATSRGRTGPTTISS